MEKPPQLIFLTIFYRHRKIETIKPMVLSRFSRVMIGTEAYLDLLVNLMLILKTNEFYILIKHQGLNYRIKAIYDLNLNKLKYPKNFRKVIYDAEPEVIMESEDDYGRAIPVAAVSRDFDGCVLYRVKINIRESSILITGENETVRKINELTSDNICHDDGYYYGFGYSFYAEAYATNRSYRWVYN